MDETSTRDIHEYTTEPRYLTPMVSYVPDHPDVPSPGDVLGYTVGTEGILTRPEDEIAYLQTLADASPNVELREMGETEEGRTMHLVIVSGTANLAPWTNTRASLITDVDGRARVVDWYYRHLKDYDSRHYMPSISPPYWGKYVFHDNNRDGIQMTQKLTQHYMSAFIAPPAGAWFCTASIPFAGT